MQHVALSLGSDVPFPTAAAPLEPVAANNSRYTPNPDQFAYLTTFWLLNTNVFKHRTEKHPSNSGELHVDDTTLPVNELEAPAIVAYPQLAPYIKATRAAGSGMSGSGSTCLVPGHDFQLDPDLPATIVPVDDSVTKRHITCRLAHKMPQAAARARPLRRSPRAATTLLAMQ